MSRFDPARAATIGDLRELARRRVPRMVFDYIDGGADAEVSLRGNCRVFEEITFRPRAAVSTPSVELRTTVAGTTIELPFMLAPIGSSRLFYPRGEVAAASAAGQAGTGYVLSTLSGCALEDVKAASRGPVWYQVYLVGGRDVARRSRGRRPPVSPDWSSRWTRRSPGCASVTSATAFRSS
jgi:L-lactate dehydrogenase (cytochrome)